MIKRRGTSQLAHFEAFGYVIREENGRYRLGPRIHEAALTVQSRKGLVDFARKHMIRLRDKFEETVNLATLRRNEIIYVDILELRHALTNQSP